MRYLDMARGSRHASCGCNLAPQNVLNELKSPDFFHRLSLDITEELIKIDCFVDVSTFDQKLIKQVDGFIYWDIEKLPGRRFGQNHFVLVEVGDNLTIDSLQRVVVFMGVWWLIR